MSPRGFRLGLALFLVLSGLFAAKLSVLTPGALRPGRWSVDTTASIATSPAGPGTTVQAEPQRARQEKSDASDVREGVHGEEESASHSSAAAVAEPSLVIAIKRELKARGYGPSDESGTLSLADRGAIMAFEGDQHLPLTGIASEPLLHRLLLGAGATDAGSSMAANTGADVVRAVQVLLGQVGHGVSSGDGQFDAATVSAIRAFERAQGMKVTGRISGELVSRLERVARDGAKTAGG